MIKKLSLLWAILLCEGAGIVGSFFTFSEVNSWYRTLNKPFFNPPSWVFGPVWTILYLLMGISLYLIWKAKDKKEKRSGLRFFYIQLGLNALWSMLFFGIHSPAVAFAEIVVLWVTIWICIKKFKKVSKPAAYLLYPYLAWVSFASVLNLAIAVLN